MALIEDELLNLVIFDTLLEEEFLTEDWRHDCNIIRPYNSFNDAPSAPESRPAFGLILATTSLSKHGGGALESDPHTRSDIRSLRSPFG